MTLAAWVSVKDPAKSFIIKGVARRIMPVSDGRRRGFLDWEISILARAWLTPRFWRPLAQLGHLPLGTLISLALPWLTWRRVQASRGDPMTGSNSFNY